MAPRDKKGILFISRAVEQSYLSVLCVHSRLANVLLRFNLDNKFQRGGGTESYVHEQTLENQSRQLPELALLSRSLHLWQIDGEAMQTATGFILVGSKITADGDCIHEIQRHLLLGRKVMTNLGSILKSRGMADSCQCMTKPTEML